MDAYVVDTRGLSCPQPVLETLEAIRQKGSGEIVVLVDTDTARENVSRASQSSGWTVRQVEPEGTGYRIVIGK